MKYDLSKIMKRAWALVKEFGMTISSSLKMAWAEAKLKAQMISKMEYLVSIATDVYNYSISARDWENYGKSRTYLKIFETRRNSTHNKVYECGYIDNQKNVYVPGKIDLNDKYSLSGNAIR